MKPHSTIARVVIALEIFLSVGALAGGATLFLYPDGSAFRMPLSMLEHTGFASFLIPGLVLFVVNGLLPLVSAAAVLVRRPWAATSVIAVGVLLVGWITVQVALLRAFHAPLHGGYLLLGFVITALGVALREGHPRGAVAPADARAGFVAVRGANTIEATQRVLLLQKFGGVDGFAVVERPVPEAGVGEVLVKVLAASVQFTDVILRRGRYPDLKEKPPLVLGYDLVGEVVELGPGVSTLAVGQRVADLTMTGSYAQYRTLEADRVTNVDAALDPAEATSLVLSWMIAYQLLHRDAHVRMGQKLLVIGAAGAVGQALVVLAGLAGCEVWGAARAGHAELVRVLGATHIDSDQADFAKVLPDGFDAVFDGIGEDGFSRAWRAVGPRGHLSAYGFSAGVKRNAPLALVGVWIAKLWWWNRFAGTRSTSFVSITSLREKHPDWFLTDLGVLFDKLARGEIRPRVAERIGFAAVADAHTRLERGGLEGKIVLVPGRGTESAYP